MKSIRIDCRMREFSGIGTYIRGLLDGFRSIMSPNVSVAALQTREWPIYSIQEQGLIPMAFLRSGANFLHSPHYNVPISIVSKTIVTVHDLIHLLFPQFLPSKLSYSYANFMLRVIVPKARSIVTVSEHTKRDLIKILNIAESRITVTPLSSDPIFTPATQEEMARIRAEYRVPEQYFLYVGNLKEFKNIPLLLKVYSEIRRRTPGCPALVLAGRNMIKGFDEVLRNSEGVIPLANISRKDLPGLYSGALAFVYPSLYEGFGLPPLEAMACGAPVLCSDAASLPEVVGDAALLIDPLDDKSLANGMLKVIQDSELRKNLSAKGLIQAKRFSWTETANKTLRVYERAFG